MSNKRLWAERRAKGLCGQCGYVESKRFSRCDLCREHINEVRGKWWRGGAKWAINHKQRQRKKEDPEFREHINARQRQWHKDNREKALAGMRRWYLANHERALKYFRDRYYQKKSA